MKFCFTFIVILALGIALQNAMANYLLVEVGDDKLVTGKQGKQ